jgi:hypothetical protein
VDYYGDALKYPINCQTNVIHVEATNYVLQWKKEREQQMQVVNQIVSDLFDVNQPMPLVPPTKGGEEPDPRVEAIVSRLFASI